jgi:hypothetical protein
MKQKSPTDSGLKVGDRARLVSETPLWKIEPLLQGKIGDIIESFEDGNVRKVTIRYSDGRLLMCKDGRLFERS